MEQTQLTYRRQRRHTDLVQQLHKLATHVQTNLKKDPCWRSFNKVHIREVIIRLQSGVLEMECNLRGNFANMCRAVVTRTMGLPDWSFAPLFLKKLGLEPSPSERILTRVPSRAVLIENCSLESQIAFTVEDMAVAIARKKSSRVGRGLVFNCMVLQRKDAIDELVGLLTDLQTKAIERPEKNFRFQVLYKTFDHWSTLDISYKAGRFSVYLVDSANVINIIIDVLLLLVSKLPGSLFYYTGGPFQFDRVSCAIFAFDHACSLARIPDLHEQLARFEKNPSFGRYSTFVDYVRELMDSDNHYIRRFLERGPFLRTIEKSAQKEKILRDMAQLTYVSMQKLAGDLAPLIRNIQSFDTLRFYLELSPAVGSSKGGYRTTSTLIEKIEQHTRLFDGKISRNYSADDKRGSVKSKTKTFLESLSEDNYLRLLLQRNCLPLEAFESDHTDSLPERQGIFAL